MTPLLPADFIQPEPANNFAHKSGPVDKSKKTAETHSGSSRTVNLGIAKDGIYHPLEV